MDKKRKKILILVIIVIAIILICLLSVILMDNKVELIEQNIDNSNEVIINSNYINEEYNLKTQQESDENNSDKRQRFENFANNNELIKAPKTIYVDDYEIKLEDGKVKVLDNEFLSDVNFIMAGIKDNKLTIYGILKDGTVSCIELGLDSSNNIDLDNINVINNFNDLKYIIDYKVQDIVDIDGNDVRLFYFIDIDGQMIVDK